MGLPQQAWVEKWVHGVETQWHSSKEKVLGAMVGKEGDADNLLEDERIHHYWFPWKTVFPIANSWQIYLIY